MPVRGDEDCGLDLEGSTCFSDHGSTVSNSLIDAMNQGWRADHGYPLATGRIRRMVQPIELLRRARLSASRAHLGFAVVENALGVLDTGVFGKSFSGLDSQTASHDRVVCEK